MNDAIEFLGTTDDVTTCDCCGKSNLKNTVGLCINDEIVHYGVTCAARALRKSVQAIRSSARYADYCKAEVARLTSLRASAVARLHAARAAGAFVSEAVAALRSYDARLASYGVNMVG